MKESSLHKYAVALTWVKISHDIRDKVQGLKVWNRCGGDVSLKAKGPVQQY
jgi:hypothetical protein